MIGYSVAQGVAHIRLNRPEASNALDLDTARAFASAVEQATTSDEVRAVLITGEGRRFCAGGDVASFAQAADQPAYIHQLASELDAGFQRLAALEHARGRGGAGGRRRRGAGADAQLRLDRGRPGNEVRVRLPRDRLHARLRPVVPPPPQHRAATGAALRLDGRASLRRRRLCTWGMVTEVSADALGRGTELATALASGSAKALGQCRRLIRSGWEMDRAAVGAEETRTVTEMVKGAEAQTLIARFGAASADRSR